MKKLTVAVVALLPVLGFPDTASAQDQQRACYIPEVGAVYRIGETGLPAECLEATHVEFSWEAAGHDHTTQNLQGNALSAATPADGQVLAWNASTSQWEPTDPESTQITVTGTFPPDLEPGVETRVIVGGTNFLDVATMAIMEPLGACVGSRYENVGNNLAFLDATCEESFRGRECGLLVVSMDGSGFTVPGAFTCRDQ